MGNKLLVIFCCYLFTKNMNYKIIYHSKEVKKPYLCSGGGQNTNPSPWTTLKILVSISTIERTAIYILTLQIPCLFSSAFGGVDFFVFKVCSLRTIIQNGA